MPELRIADDVSNTWLHRVYFVRLFSSGQLLEYLGWQAINEVIFPTVLVAGAMLVWLALRKRAQPV